MNIHWWPSAALAMLNMPRADAEVVDRAVKQGCDGRRSVLRSEHEVREERLE
jgi:hypothetical protein